MNFARELKNKWQDNTEFKYAPVHDLTPLLEMFGELADNRDECYSPSDNNLTAFFITDNKLNYNDFINSFPVEARNYITFYEYMSNNENNEGILYAYCPAYVVMIFLGQILGGNKDVNTDRFITSLNNTGALNSINNAINGITVKNFILTAKSALKIKMGVIAYPHYIDAYWLLNEEVVC